MTHDLLANRWSEIDGQKEDEEEEVCCEYLHRVGLSDCVSHSPVWMYWSRGERGTDSYHPAGFQAQALLTRTPHNPADVQRGIRACTCNIQRVVSEYKPHT